MKMDDLEPERVNAHSFLVLVMRQMLRTGRYGTVQSDILAVVVSSENQYFVRQFHF